MIPGHGGLLGSAACLCSAAVVVAAILGFARGRADGVGRWGPQWFGEDMSPVPLRNNKPAGVRHMFREPGATGLIGDSTMDLLRGARALTVARRAADPWCCRRSNRWRRARSRNVWRTPLACCYARELGSYPHQTIRPRPTPSAPPRSDPKIAATTTAATKPSSRSSSPPWPGMIWLKSLTPKRRFTADSNRSPS